MNEKNCLYCNCLIPESYKLSSGYGTETEFCSDVCYNQYHGFNEEGN